MNIYSYFKNLGYSDAEIEETLFRAEYGLPMPENVKSDYRNFHPFINNTVSSGFAISENERAAGSHGAVGRRS